MSRRLIAITRRYLQTLLVTRSLLLSQSFQLHNFSNSFKKTSIRFNNNIIAEGSYSYSYWSLSATMPRGVKKENLPTKVCVVCNRPFTWRKKWEKVWDEVSTCSKSCNRKRKEEKNTQKYMLKCESKKDGGCDHSINSLNCCNKGGEDFEIISEVSERENMNEAPASNIGQESIIGGSSDDVDDSAPFDLLKQLQIDDESFQSDNNSNASEEKDAIIDDPVALRKAQRKAEKKRKKQERRAQREGRGDPTAGQKQCDMCAKSVDLLVRCIYDESQEWKMVCGKCWKVASGGVVDGDSSHPYYKYGGLWKNRRRK